jgi:hypothetical protein
MLVTVQQTKGRTEQIEKSSAEMAVYLGYYQYNKEKDVYEYTQQMLDLIEEERKKLHKS